MNALSAYAPQYPLEMLTVQDRKRAGRPGSFPCVLTIAEDAISAELTQTALWRHDLVRIGCSDADHGLNLASTLGPDLVIVALGPSADPAELVKNVRRVSPRSGIVVIAPVLTPESRSEIEAEGAAAIWTGAPAPRLWDELVGHLFGLSIRRSLRVPVRLHVWSRRPAQPEAIVGLAVDLSVGGMLMESPCPLEVGAGVELTFMLPHDGDSVRVAGRVVREARPDPLPRYGIEFFAFSPQARDRIARFVESTRPAGARGLE